MKPTKKIMSVKFDGAREFIDFMNHLSRRLWISADDPQLMTLKAVDENLEYVLELTIKDYRETEHLLNEKEKNIFRNDLGGNKRYWELTGEKLSLHQEFLLGPNYWHGMANYLQRKFKEELKESLLRINGKVEELKPGTVPLYDVNPEKSAYYFDEDGDKIVEVKDKTKTRMYIPIFEISQSYFKECENIWDVKVDDFVENKILERENFLYKRIIEEIGEIELIIVPVFTSLTVLPCMDWAQGKAGFAAFENLGVGIYPK